MKKTSKHLRATTGYILTALVIFVAITLFTKGRQNPSNSQTQSPSLDMATPGAGMQPKQVATSENESRSLHAPIVKQNKKLSYGEALVAYQNSRIQFSDSCQATPKNQTYKVGTNLMLDNRANVPRAIVFGGHTYVIEPYGFTVVPLDTASIFTINCGDARNVATISVQS